MPLTFLLVSLSDLGRSIYNLLRFPLIATLFILHSALFMYLALTVGVFFWLFFFGELATPFLVAWIILKHKEVI